MIKIKDLMLMNEDRNESVDDVGCLMVVTDPKYGKILNDFGKKLISDDDLYVEGDEYGRERFSHITVHYGTLRDLTEQDIRKIIGKDNKQFMVTLTTLDKFEPEGKEYDVVILRADNPLLEKWHNDIDKNYPHEKSKFDGYNAHLTLFYCKKGKWNREPKEVNIEVLITQLCYNSIGGKKTYYNLAKSDDKLVNENHHIDINHLEKEWDRLDSTGSGSVRQKEIERELEKLKKKKVHPDDVPRKYNDPKSQEFWRNIKDVIK